MALLTHKKKKKIDDSKLIFDNKCCPLDDV